MQVPENRIAMCCQRTSERMEDPQEGRPLEARRLPEAVPFKVKHELEEP